MGLTYSACTKEGLKDLFNIEKENADDFVIALAGNPNTGKSTVFNALTGLHQHTGNWPGKTVTNAQGNYVYEKKNFILVDLPGTYSLLASSVEEEVARDFICFGKPNATVVVIDSTCIERNLNLLLQILEITDKVIVCLNLMDEAKKKNIEINVNLLSDKLGVPIVPCAARNYIGINKLKRVINNICHDKIKTNPLQIEYDQDIKDEVNKIYPVLERNFKNIIPPKWLALRLLDGDESILKSIGKYINYDLLEHQFSGGSNK